MLNVAKSLLKLDVFINAMLFNVVWLACVAGSAKQLLWPAVVSCGVLAVYQLAPARRHHNDLLLVAVSIVLGLVVDSIWIQLDYMNFTQKWPFENIAPAWIIVLWVGFALTINHSLKWLKVHALLPAITGAIAAPVTYFAGIKIGAVEYTASVTHISIGLAIAWAISLTLLVELSKRNDPISCEQPS